MSRALLVGLSLFVATCALAQAPTRRRAPVVLPKTSAADAQAYQQTFEFVLLQAGQSYLKDQAMPDPTALDAFIATLKEPELGKAKANRRRLEDVIASAEWVQQGRGGVAPDVYKLMVDQAADDLGVGTIVEENFVPNERAGRSLDSNEKALAKECQGIARNQAYDRRGFYQRCLGRQKAEDVYLDPLRSASGGTAADKSPAAARLLAEISAARAKLPSGLSDEIGQKLKATQDALTAGARSPVGSVADSTGVKSPAGFQRVAPKNPDTAGESFKQADGLKTTEPPLNKADLGAGTKLAHVVKADEIGFTGYCYSYVKSALQKAGIVNRDDIAKVNAHRRAEQFNGFVQKNPGLLKRKLLRLPEPSWPLPIGTVVVWSPGACGYDATAGHIEIVTRIKPPQACSDGCGTFQTACLDELAIDPGRAKLALPQVQQDYDEAQAAYNALTDRRAKARAAPALAKKKAALADVKDRLDAQVAAYVIER